MAERMVETNGVELCTEAFGDPADPPILLVMGTGSSMLWWEDELCRMLADGGRFVIRYDHRDTGRSVSYEPGRPGYTSADLVGDAAGVLDGYGISAAHVVGMSMGGAIAQLLALEWSDCVSSLVLISTTPSGSGDDDFPPMSDGYARFAASAEVDWSEPESVIAYLVDDSRALTGDGRRFDEAGVRALAVADVERARNIASAQNHFALAGDEGRRERSAAIAAPTLVIHGSSDPLFPLGHGEALAREIPGARLLTLEGAGHELNRADWDAIVAAILEHTGGATEGPRAQP
ncbi:MAG: alpha/beta fold hydrolase [Solirubrobacterales bacterium]